MKAIITLAILISVISSTSICATRRVPPPPSASKTFTLTSSSFTNKKPIPKQFTCDDANESPHLEWHNHPKDTKSFALIVHDPDAPSKNFIHWVVYNIPPDVTNFWIDDSKILENNKIAQGKNDFGTFGYGGPCPPKGKQHNYVFTLYALKTMLDLPPHATAQQLQNAMKPHIIKETKLIGTYKRA